MKILCTLLAAVWFYAAFAPPGESAIVEQLLAEINKLPPQERQTRLEEGAKKEGNLTVYSNSGMTTIRAYANGFKAKYPFVKINASRLQGARGLDRILLEHRVGKLQADVAGVEPWERDREVWSL